MTAEPLPAALAAATPVALAATERVEATLAAYIAAARNRDHVVVRADGVQ